VGYIKQTRWVKRVKRGTTQIFDLILKRLLRLSGPAVVQFINGLFGTNHPLDSKVEYPSTESVSRKLRKLLSDMIVIVNGVHYHIEAEIRDDETIVIRVFEYGFAEGLRTMTVLGGGERITLKFPNARIIYWETTKKAPDEAVLALEFPDGGHYDYKVKTLKFLEHDIEELEKRKLALLLPFHVLKLRKEVVSAKTSSTRTKLAEEMKRLLDEVIGAIDRVADAGLMSESDSRSLLEYTERLYKELYKEYDEFKEVDVVLQDTILTYSEEAELRGIKKGRREGKAEGKAEGIAEMARNLLRRGVAPDVVAESAGLPLDKIRALLN
jgi:hypothetical protein